MLDQITGDDIFNTVAMLITVPGRSTLVLMEGPPDCATLGPHVDHARTSLIPCHGVENLMRAIELVDQAQIEGVLAIRDRDWIGILVPPPPSANIVLTDLYDLDATLLLKTAICIRIISVLSPPSGPSAASEAMRLEEARTAAVSLAGAVGRLRLTSERQHLGLSLRLFPVHEVVEAEGATISLSRLIELACQRSRVSPVNPEVVRGQYEAEPERDFDELCCGHDLGASLALICQRLFGASVVKRDTVLQMARSALSCAELWTCHLFSRVKEWQERTGWKVWNCDPMAADV